MGKHNVETKNEGLVIRLPDSVCRQLNLTEGDALEISVDGDRGVLTRAGKYTAPIVKVHNRCSVVMG